MPGLLRTTNTGIGSLPKDQLRISLVQAAQLAGETPALVFEQRSHRLVRPVGRGEHHLGRGPIESRLKQGSADARSAPTRRNHEKTDEVSAVEVPSGCDHKPVDQTGPIGVHHALTRLHPMSEIGGPVEVASGRYVINSENLIKLAWVSGTNHPVSVGRSSDRVQATPRSRLPTAAGRSARRRTPHSSPQPGLADEASTFAGMRSLVAELWTLWAPHSSRLSPWRKFHTPGSRAWIAQSRERRGL